MLNKELLMRNTGGQQPVALTVGSYRISGPYFYYGYDRGRIGALAPVPFWDNNAHLSTLRYDNQNNRTTCAATDRSVNLTVYISGYQDSPISSGESISGDPFRFTVKVGQTVYLTFDPPPLSDIYKKVKQVFTRSQKEGVVNAGEGNVGGRVYFEANSHNKVLHGIGDGVGVSPNDLSPLWRVDLGESRRRYHHGHSDVRDRRGYKRPCFYPHFWRRPYTSNTRKYDWNIEHRSSARDYVLQDQRQIEGCVRRIHPLRRNIGLSKEVPYAA